MDIIIFFFSVRRNIWGQYSSYSHKANGNTFKNGNLYWWEITAKVFYRKVCSKFLYWLIKGQILTVHSKKFFLIFFDLVSYWSEMICSALSVQTGKCMIYFASIGRIISLTFKLTVLSVCSLLIQMDLQSTTQTFHKGSLAMRWPSHRHRIYQCGEDIPVMENF